MQLKRLTTYPPLPFVLFGLYFFAFMLLESMVNDRAAALLGAQIVTVVYGCGLLCTMLGYCLFPIAFRLRETLPRNCAMGASAFLFLVCPLALALSNNAVIALVAGFLGLVALGFFGSASHTVLGASLSAEARHFGSKLGLTAAFAITVQYFTQSLLQPTIALVVATLPLVVLAFLLVGQEGQGAPTGFPTPAETEPAGKNHAPFATFVAAVAIMTVICSLNDCFMVQQNASGEVSLFGAIRLTYAVALLIAGIVADRVSAVAFQLFAAVAMTLSVAAVVLLSDIAFYQLNMAVMYFYSGFYVMFLTLGGIRLSQNVSNPALWAGMGRIVRCLSLAAATLLMEVLSIPFNYLAMSLLCSALCVVLFILLVVVNSRAAEAAVAVDADAAKTTAPVRPSPMLSEEEIARQTALQFAFTQREEEVFLALVTTEKTTQQIADDLYVSRRVLQRHISAIYEKTGTSSRTGLVLLLVSAHYQPDEIPPAGE